MTFAESSQPVRSIEGVEDQIEDQPAETTVSNEDAATSASEESADAARRRILIGSQRDPAAYRARARRDWTPVEEKQQEKQEKKERKPQGERHDRQEQPSEAPVMAATPKIEPPRADSRAVEASTAAKPVFVPSEPAPLARPSVRHRDLDLEEELSRTLAGASMDDLLGGSGKTEMPSFEPDSLQTGRVAAVRRDDVFVEFAGREQGIVSLRLFDVPPRVGADVQVVIQRLNPEDGLYELSLPNKAVQVDDWSDLVEGMMIEVRVTGHNTGGLECEVNHIRGFIPISQVSLYRIDDLAPYVDQRLACIITEANPDRRNLVLSHRAVLEREKEQARDQMLGSLQPGQIFDGVVRKLMDFGAFVDIGGGVDGLIHVSQVAWGRVKHPSDVLKEGQAVKVRIDKIDPTTRKISLGYRDLMESPWTNAAQKYPLNGVVRGKVVKLMDFGAFVELEPGVEGLVHVSELSHKRVWRPSDVVKEGDEIDVLVLSVDADAQRISLSMKACSTPSEPVKKEEDEDAAAPEPSKKKSNKPTGPLQGGLGRSSDNPFGLKW